MLAFQHSIRKQTIEIEVDSETLALALQPRMSDINQKYFLPVIERVLDEFSVPGRQIKVATLTIDLGRLPLTRFEEEAAERLYSELRRAIEEVLWEDSLSPGSSNRSQSEATSRLQLLEYYLLHGTLPFWAPHATRFSFEEFLLELAESDPDGLVAVVRKLGRQTRVLERIILQFGESLLHRLLYLLDEEHAALIIAYTIDLQEIHRVEPVLALSEKQFARLLWLLVLSYLVQNPGSQFNRKSFIKSLLENMAESEALDYLDILTTLRLGLQKVEKNYLPKSSLPAIIRELVREFDLQSAERARSSFSDQAATRASSIDQTLNEGDLSDLAVKSLDLLEQYLRTGQTSADLSELLRALALHEASRTRQHIRLIAHHSKPGLSVVVDRLLKAFSFEQVLAVLAPEHQMLIAEYVSALNSVRARTASVSLAPHIAQDRAIWKMMLEYLLEKSSGRLDLPAMVRQTVETIAGRSTVSARSLIEALAAQLTQAAVTPDGSLTEALEEVRQALGDRPRPMEQARPVFARYDQVETLCYYLYHGMLPWSALIRDPELTAESLIASLPGLSRSLLGAVFFRIHPDKQPQAMLRAVRKLSDDGLAQLLLRLLPRAKDADNPFWSAVSDFASKAVDKPAFYARLIAAILHGHSLDLEELTASAPIESQTIESILPNDLADWDAHTLKSVLAGRLRARGTTGASKHSLADLFETLVVKHTEDARHFFHAAQGVPGLRAALVEECPPPLFDRILDLLCPGGAETLNALMGMLARIPAAYRPQSEENMRQMVFYEVLLLNEGQPLSKAFFVRVLRKLFGTPVSGQVCDFLLQEVAALSSQDGLPALHLAALEAAITVAGDRDDRASNAEKSTVDEREQVIDRGAALREAVFAFLLGVSGAANVARSPESKAEMPQAESLSTDALMHTLHTMLEESPEEVYTFVTEHLANPRTQERWVKILPESALVRLSYLIEPRKHRILLDAAEVLASALLEAVLPSNPTLTSRELFWSFLLEFFARNNEVNRSVERLAAAFFEFFAARYLAVSSGTSDSAVVGASLFEHAAQLASTIGHTSLVAILHRDRSLLVASWERSASVKRALTAGLKEEAERQPGDDGRLRARRRHSGMAFSLATDEDDVMNDPIYIGNAGLVLTSAFLPHMFKTLDMLEQDEKGRIHLRDKTTMSRAVHLLQYLVDGSTSAPEPLLTLNKILCGMPTGAPVERKIEATDQEREVCDHLLKSIIANWKIIENTSIEGLQETFLQREGKLHYLTDGWRLQIQRKTLDILVDQIPWTISIVYHDWMAQPLYVTW